MRVKLAFQFGSRRLCMSSSILIHRASLISLSIQTLTWPALLGPALSASGRWGQTINVASHLVRISNFPTERTFALFSPGQINAIRAVALSNVPNPAITRHTSIGAAVFITLALLCIRSTTRTVAIKRSSGGQLTFVLPLVLSALLLFTFSPIIPSLNLLLHPGSIFYQDSRVASHLRSAQINSASSSCATRSSLTNAEPAIMQLIRLGVLTLLVRQNSNRFVPRLKRNVLL